MIDLTGRSDIPVTEEVLAELAELVDGDDLHVFARGLDLVDELLYGLAVVDDEA